MNNSSDLICEVGLGSNLSHYIVLVLLVLLRQDSNVAALLPVLVEHLGCNRIKIGVFLDLRDTLLQLFSRASNSSSAALSASSSASFASS